MLWIPQRSLLFIHNPKCAGTTVHKALLAAFPDAQEFWGRAYLRKTDGIVDLAHLTIGDAQPLIASDLPIRSFGFVRNPYRRFLSSYRYFKRWNSEYGALTLEELAFDVLDEERIRCDWKFVHFSPQYRFFYVDGQREVGRIFRVEDLPKAWDRIRVAFDIDAELKRENQEDARGGWLPDRVIGRINTLYARDFAYFGYARRPACPRPVPRPYPAFSTLWPEYRALDVSDRNRT
jgi:hypothetical protein